MKVLGLLPARGGSKGIPGKNLRPLHGRPLLAWAADALTNCSRIARRVCSTDDEAIARAARESGLDVPFLRPSLLATDTATAVDVVAHALDALDDPQDPFTHVVLVQATTPTVRSEDLDSALTLIDEKGADTVITGFLASSQHPAMMYTESENDGQVKCLLGGENFASRRQDLPAVFVRTGLLYLVSAETVRVRNSLYGDRVYSLVVDESRAVTIDEEADFIRAERLLEVKS